MFVLTPMGFGATLSVFKVGNGYLLPVMLARFDVAFEVATLTVLCKFWRRLGKALFGMSPISTLPEGDLAKLFLLSLSATFKFGSTKSLFDSSLINYEEPWNVYCYSLFENVGIYSLTRAASSLLDWRSLALSARLY